MRRFLVPLNDSRGKENENQSNQVPFNSRNLEGKPAAPITASIIDLDEALVKKEVTEFRIKDEFQYNSKLFQSFDAVQLQIRNYIPCSPSQPLPYSALVDTFEAVSNSSGRLDKESFFSRLFASIILQCPRELESIVYLASGHVFPAYAGLELGVGDILLIKAIASSTGRRLEDINHDYDREGDLGIAAVQSRAKQRILTGFGYEPKPLDASGVLETFRFIANIKGKDAQSRKIEKMRSLLTRCNPQGQEAKYIVRGLQGKLRIGTAAPTILVSLAHSIVEVQKLEMSQWDSYPPEEVERNRRKEEEHQRISQHDKELKELPPLEENKEAMKEVVSQSLSDLINAIHDKETVEARHLRLHFEGKHTLTKEKLKEYCEIAVRRAFSECPNFTLLVSALLNHPIHTLYERCKLEIGIPVAPMLAKPSKEVTEVMKRLSGLAFTMEYKYDGERAQIHLLSDGTVKIFSRNSEDNTEKYPDLKDVIL
jgi:DNA ligase-1